MVAVGGVYVDPMRRTIKTLIIIMGAGGGVWGVGWGGAGGCGGVGAGSG